MKRYAITVGWSGRQNEPTRSIKEAPDGEWVRYEDAHEVQKERDEALKQVQELQEDADDAKEQDYVRFYGYHGDDDKEGDHE